MSTFQKQLERILRMNNFELALEQGCKETEIIKQNKAIITDMLTKFCNAISSHTEGNVTAELVKTDDIAPPLQHVYECPTNYIHTAQDALILDNGKSVIIAYWRQDERGFPCFLTKGYTQVVCSDAETLETELLTMLKDGILARVVKELAKPHQQGLFNEYLYTES